MAVDWHLTFGLQHLYERPEAEGNFVPLANKEGGLRLQTKGWELILLSFCGRDRERETRSELEALSKGLQPFRFSQVVFVNEPLGERGKASRAVELGCSCLCDDRQDVGEEALAKGLRVFPIRTSWNGHGSWASRAFDSFAEVAEMLLEEE